MQEARFLIKLDGEDRARAVRRIAAAKLPSPITWIHIQQCNGDELLIPRDRIAYILLKDKSAIKKLDQAVSDEPPFITGKAPHE